MEIKLRLYKNEILKAVKDETFLSGRAMLSADGSNTEQVYNLQAGDDATHEAKLLRSVRVCLDELKSRLTNFVKNDGYSTGDNISDTLSDEYDYFDVVLSVSDRFNKGYVDSLTHLCSDYITSSCIGHWWIAVNPSLAANYYTSASSTLESIKRCFIKVPPKRPVFLYPKGVLLLITVNSISIGSRIPLPYSLIAQDDAGGRVVDDVVAASSDERVACVDGTVGSYELVGVGRGSCTVMLSSRHNPSASVELKINVV